jgi:hypothetical protein
LLFFFCSPPSCRWPTTQEPRWRSAHARRHRPARSQARHEVRSVRPSASSFLFLTASLACLSRNTARAPSTIHSRNSTRPCSSSAKATGGASRYSPFITTTGSHRGTHTASLFRVIAAHHEPGVLGQLRARPARHHGGGDAGPLPPPRLQAQGHPVRRRRPLLPPHPRTPTSRRQRLSPLNKRVG